ncbi:hypothetical protein [Spirillospora sp. NPDC048819]|uniref:hypothetical protein n=1 Tax=Spirillospora sp. NPDC048819 TaxID=3155268 RepID=UPI0033D96038
MNFRPLGGLDDVDWASLEHAHGSAEDVPGLLRAAVGRGDDAAAEAFDDLASRLAHQGTLYPATAAAVPFLIALATSRRTRRRPEVLRQLAWIAQGAHARPGVLDDVQSALAAGAARLLKLHFDPDVHVRRCASYVVGHLPAESVPLATLRKLRDGEGDSEAIAELLIVAGRLHPRDAADWLQAELAPDRPLLPRAAAAWTIAVHGETFGPAATAAVRECWAACDPFRDFVWSQESLSDIIAGAPEADAVDLARSFVRDGSPENANAVVNGVQWRCYWSRSARTRFADLLAEAVSHREIEVRAAAAELLVEVRQVVPAAVAALADYAQSPPRTALTDHRNWKGLQTAEGRLLAAALRMLVLADDPAWPVSVTGAFGEGWFDGGTVDLLAERKAPYDPALLKVLRPHLASAGLETLMAHEPDVAIPGLLITWGSEAAAAAPELSGLVRAERLAPVRALRAIGPGASAAVPALRDAVTGTGQWDFREACADALAVITGDTGYVTRFAFAAADAGEVVRAAELMRAHGLPPDAFLPALRELASTETADFEACEKRIEAAGLVLDLTGDTRTALLAAEQVLAHGRAPARGAALLAGRLGEEASALVPVLLDLGGDEFYRYEAALAVRRINGDPGPFLDAVARRIAEGSARPWLHDAARELGGDIEPLIPLLRTLAETDRNTVNAPFTSVLIPDDLEQQAVLADLLAAHDGEQAPE